MPTHRPPAAQPEGWRRRPLVRAEGMETSGVAFVDATPRWHLSGPHVKEDLERIMQGLICIKCWQPFPCRLGLGSRRRIMQDCAPFGRPDWEVARLLDASHCPFCGAEVSPEMAAVFFHGYVKRVNDAAIVEPGGHGDYENLIGGPSKEQQLYLPPGWGS